ncbi:MAG: C10 family peptidase [Bacteroidales bacterium]|jgi:hypothetical protein|nr:C10 family peptidase [Bacteroidales bacterium]
MSPLLNTKWDQGIFYNGLCPEDPAGIGGRVYTGCVATALGQLMNYFRYPVTGTGSYGYDHPDYGWLEVDFSQQTYDYDKMPVKPTDENNEIARLLYDIGVSVDMEYGPDGSGMTNHKGAYTLRTYFGYNPDTKYLFKDSLPEDFDWNGTLVDHLNQKIPLYYAGWADYDYVSGHAFIFDGYSDSTHYHINWGWGGSLDGYFLIDNLKPGGNNFTLAHEVIVNAVPNVQSDYCNGLKILNSLEGIIDDGSGPLHNYENNTECLWLIAPEDTVKGMILEFLKFDLDSEDYVMIFEGDSETSPVLATFYGDQVPGSLQTNSGKILIKFVTDSDSVNDGWIISYKWMKPELCSGTTTLTSDQGIITDGSNEYKYMNNMFCQWLIRPENAKNIRLTFLEFDLNPRGHILMVYDANNNLIAEISGSDIPDPILIDGNKAALSFSANGGLRAQGFKILYETNIDNYNPLHSLQNNFIYPNPASDILYLNTEDVHEDLHIKIFTNDGKIYYEKNISQNLNNKIVEINISNLSPGIYFISLSGNHEIKNYKFIKN